MARLHTCPVKAIEPALLDDVADIADRHGIESDEIAPEADLFEQGYIDSLGVFNLLPALPKAWPGGRVTDVKSRKREAWPHTSRSKA